MPGLSSSRWNPSSRELNSSLETTTRTLDSMLEIVDSVDDETGLPMLDHLGHGASAPRDDRRAARHRFDLDETERFGPIDGKQQRHGPGEEGLLFE